MTTGVIKLTGNTFVVNSTPNTVPTNAPSYISAPTPNTASGGVAPATAGGATVLYIVSTGSAGIANVTVANSGVNTTITMAVPDTMILTKYAHDLISSMPNVYATPIAFKN